MKTILILVISLGLIVPVAQADKKPSNSDGGTHRADSDTRGTPEAPLIVDEHPIQSDKETAKEATRDAEQKHTDTWLIGLTFAIAACALLQFFGICGQIFVYVKQKTIMKDTLDAISTQAGHMAGQLKEMEKARILQFRPKLVVRAVSAKEARISFLVTNVGGTKAQLTSCIPFAVSRGKTSTSGDLVENLPIAKVMFEPGQVRRYSFSITQEIMESIEDLYESFRTMGTTKSLPKVFCGGILRYLDDSGIERDTGFDRIYIPKYAYFVRRKKGEGEYAD